MEHVEVNEKMQTHNLFRDTICGNNAYGADRWVMTLERMCERFASYSAKTIPSCETGGGWLLFIFFARSKVILILIYLICDHYYLFISKSAVHFLSC